MAKVRAHALAAIDTEGRWIVYGFPELQTVPHLHETGVTEDVGEELEFYRIEFDLDVPEQKVISGADVVTISKIQQ